VRVPSFRGVYVVLLVLVGVGLVAGCRQTRLPGRLAERGIEAPPEVPREFRAAWIATVANIDWPSEPGLPVEEQKAELRRMLDEAAALNLNAVIFQVRPHADALYDSPHEPWSFYLTGEQGRAPEPAYDPLRFAVEAAHERGLELHAWFNPYRAGHPADSSALAPGHVARQHPSWVREYGAYLWLDPGVPAARDHTHRVIMDVVRRYDVDGVHFDDYFYPYPSYADGAPFPDSTSWARARANGWTGSRADWRRHNVNRLVERVYRSIKDVKPHVKFGISPFGIWRPDHPPGTRGFDAYAQLYADARTWIREGWVDYLTPQLYYRIDQFGYSYSEMLRWWIEQNHEDRHVWPGLYTSRVWMRGDRHWSDRQILGQIYTARSHPGATGQVHFSMKALMPLPDSVQRPGRPDTTVLAPVADTLRADSVVVNTRPTDSVAVDSIRTDSVSVVRRSDPPRAWRDTRRLRERLRTEAYATPALVPATPWLDDDAPDRPSVAVRQWGATPRVTITPTGDDAVRWWVVRTYQGGTWRTEILVGARRTYTVPSPADDGEPEVILVSAVDRVGNVGPAAVAVRSRPTE
jgi:uncharacterized lipoprotein YddW (UPF0748 family)